MASAPAHYQNVSSTCDSVETEPHLHDCSSSSQDLNIVAIIKQYVLDVANLSADQENSLDGVLAKALLADRQIRFLFASDSGNPCLSDLYLGLIDVFNIAPQARQIRARHIKPGTLTFLDSYVFPLDRLCRKDHMEPSTVANIETFHSNWELFTHNVLSRMTMRDWKNVIVAGGSVLACLLSTSVPSQKDLNAVYQGPVWGASDIDLFIWGLSYQEARTKMEAIYEVIRTSVPWEVTCVRKANTVSIHTAYPYRPVQIVLRLYASPAEVLAGFDVDAACCAFDGERVWVNPRSLTALIRQANTIDMERRSPSYEVRLAKYAERGFEVYIPSLSREKINPQIYDRDLTRFPNGLARLLVLERLYDSYNAYTYLKYPKTRVESDQELALENGDPLVGITVDAPQLPKSYYDGELRWVHVPYGILWDAPRIQKVIANKDAWINSPLNKVNLGRKLHKHIIFAGTMDECLNGKFCAECVRLDDNDADKVKPGDGIYIRGPVSFLTTDPGRQTITGSFHPIDDDNWQKDAYISGPRVDAEGTSRIYAIWALLQPGYLIE